VSGAGDGVAVIGHGIGLTEAASLAHAVPLHDLRLTVVLFDHRNHGRSGTDRSATGMAERYRRDVEACNGFARNR